MEDNGMKWHDGCDYCDVRLDMKVDWSDREQVLEIMRHHGCLFELAFAFSEDEEVILAAINTPCGRDVLRRIKLITKDIAINAIQMSYDYDILSDTLKDLRDIIRRDEDVSTEALIASRVISRAEVESKANYKEVVAHCLSMDRGSSAFAHLTEEYQNDPQIAIASLSKYVHHFEDMNDAIRDNEEVVMVIANKDASRIAYASKRLQGNKQIAMLAVHNYPNCLAYLSAELKDDYDVVMASVRKCGSMIRCASDRLKSNKEIAMAAISNDVKARKYIAKAIKEDNEVLSLSLDKTLFK